MAHRRAVALAQQRQGDFSRPEAGDADRPSNLTEPSADLFLDLARGYGDFELAFQPLGAGLGYLHRGLLTLSTRPGRRAAVCGDAAGAGWVILTPQIFIAGAKL